MPSGSRVAQIMALLLAAGASTASAQPYPHKAIRILTSEPGGNGDFHARLIARELAGALGQPVLVENRATIAAMDTAMKATPDGYTLLVNGTSLWIAPLMQKMEYDPVKDFAPITSTSRSPDVLVVHPAVPAKSVQELIALAKAKPAELNYAAGAGGTSLTSAELFKAMAHINIVRINYKGAGPALNDLLGGHVQLMFASAAAVAPHIRSGKLYGLAISSSQPSSLYPDLPTIAAAGLPGYENESRQGIWAPARTPSPVIQRLNREIVQVLNQASVKERLSSIGAEAAPGSPDQFANVIKSDMARIGKLIKEAGLRAN